MADSLPQTPAKPRRPFRVLFVCQSNAAWSLMAEAILNHTAGDAFHALSGGLAPARAVDPMTLEQLERAGIRTDGCFPKSALAFREERHIALDLVISSEDLLEAGYGRGWPGTPQVIHWRIPDPMEYEGRDNGRRNQFKSVFASLQRRIQLVVALPVDRLATPAGLAQTYLADRGA